MSFSRTRVKICGITRVEDALTAAYLGTDALGLVFYPKSPRCIDITSARAIIAALPPFVSTVGLFVDEEPTVVRNVLKQVRLDLIQFHGNESPDYCASFDTPYLKAFRVRPSNDLMSAIVRYKRATGFLLDAFHPDVKGGTGLAFDWSLIPREMSAYPFVLAGGLDAENVHDALSTVQPYGVDVSSGVETEKGIKCPSRMASFLVKVQQYDSCKRP